MLTASYMKKVIYCLGVVALIVGVAFGMRSFMVFQANARSKEFNKDVNSLFLALQKYKERTGDYPRGSNSDIAKDLNGENDKNLIIMVGRDIPKNTKGEFVDPWETPLRIYFSERGVLVRSAGPNRSFDDTTVVEFDDILRAN